MSATQDAVRGTALRLEPARSSRASVGFGSVDHALWMTRAAADGFSIMFAAMLAGVSAAHAVVFGLVGMAVVYPSRRVRGLIDPDPLAGITHLAGRVAFGCLVLVAFFPWLEFQASGTVKALAALGTSAPHAVSVGLFGLLALAAVLIARTAHRTVLHAIRRRGHVLENTLIVGTGPQGAALARLMQRLPEFGIRPIGFVDVYDDPDSDLPVLGTAEALPSLVREHDVTRVIVAFGGVGEHDLVRHLRRCVDQGLRLRANVLPRFFDLGVGIEGQTDDLWGIPLMPVRLPGPDLFSQFVKRAIDVVGSFLLLVLFAPVIALLAVAVKVSSPGPVLFRQDRVGQDGRVFEMLKFRSMRPADDDGSSSLGTDEDRITAVGHFMRPTHLDELPQLWNILRGDMALVGPRPETPTIALEQAARHADYDRRHRAPVGLTGWAQVNGLWGDTSMADRVRFDNRYIEDWSALREMRILFRTIPSMLGRQADEAEAEADEVEAVADEA